MSVCIGEEMIVTGVIFIVKMGELHLVRVHFTGGWIHTIELVRIINEFMLYLKYIYV